MWGGCGVDVGWMWSFCEASVSNPWNTRDKNVSCWNSIQSQTIETGEYCKSWKICLNTVYLYYIFKK